MNSNSNRVNLSGKSKKRTELYSGLVEVDRDKDKPSSSSRAGSSGASGSAVSSEAARAAAYQALLAQQQAAAQSSYQRSLAALNATYAQRARQMQAGYQDTLAQLQRQYESGAGQLNAKTENALQQAYLNYMLGLRDLPQQLAALGINGGGSQSQLAGLKNSYGNTRGQLERERVDGLSALLNTLNEGKSSALADYRNALAEDEARRMAYQLELEQNLASELAKIFSAAL